MAGTAQADGIGLPVMTIHPAASTSYPKELVNGGFQTFGNRIVDKRSGGWQYLSFVDGNGMAMEGSSERPWAKVDGWDAVKFGWKSNDSVSGHRGIVEVQRFRTAVKGSTGNVWGEIAAATQGKYLYQDIDTANTSDAMYTVRLKHASRNKDARDSMQVLVGAPGREKPVTMRRTIANAGDKAGEESTTITSTGTGQDDQWDTYEGTVLVPRGQDVTRFTFKSVADSNSAGRPDSAEGNLIDDVVFTKAYQLTYDANGGVKTRTSQIDYTTGGGTRGKVKTVRDSPAPPAGQEKIVNGDFEYSGTGAGLSDSPFNYVSLSRKSYYYKDSRNVNHRVALPAGFDAKRFAWKSDQTGKDLGNPPYEQAGDVQVWNRYDGSNHYAELTAAQAGSAIYQDIDTESDSDVQYIVSLRHASLNASHLDSMQVLIGAPGHETPVTMTRVTANGYGDKVGESSDTIATRVSNPKPADREDSDHTGQWETYTGTVTVPAGRPVTRFTFRNVSSKSAWNGNLIDDIAFTKARRLDYDANGGTKAQASQIGYRTDATQGAVETVASKTLPTELVNGSFDYLLDGGWDTISPVGRGGCADDRGWGRYTSVDPASGEYIQNAGQNPATFDSTGKWVKWPGFDAAKFGWASDQKGGQPQGGVGLTDRPNAVELQQDSVTGNTYAEIVGSERGKAILQKIDTQHDSDTVYTVRFDHASLSKEHADSMQVLVNGKPVTMTRVTSNKAGDEQGWTGTSITTHATNTNRFQHDGQWATYEGKVTIPANTPVSTFTFKALNAVDPTKGNLIDNLTFKIAYRLSYDSNGGTRAKASQISSMTEGKASETDGKVKTVADDAAGSIPSNETAGAVKQAKSKTNGSVRLAADDDVAEYAANGLPDHLVNGTFDYRGNEIINENQRVYGDTTYLAIISAKTGVIGNPLHSKLDNWDSGKFGWKSNDATAGVDTVEVQRRNHTPYPTNAGNVWGEIAAAKRGKYIYQDIATTPGVVYRWSLKHASRNADQDDSMQVMIGEPGAEAVQEATRTTSNGTDKVGEKSTTITTHGTAQDGKWETYTGTYIATSTVTRFTFRSVRDSNGQGLDFTAEGNCVDDLSFDKAYKLSYDKNSSDSTGSVPSNQYGKENTVQPAKSKTTGSVGLAADKTASGLTVHDLKKNDKGKVPSNSKADSTQPAAFKAPDAKAETIASRAAGDELAVNGGFDTPKWTIAKEGQGLPWVYVKPNAGTIRSYAQAMAGQTGVKAGGLTAATFAWQDLDAIGSNQNFELHREKDGNTAADVHAGRTVAQTVNTTPGASYTFSIRHSGRSKGNAGGVTLLTGPDKDHLTPVRLTRTTVSRTGAKYGDRIGDVGTVAYTHSDSMDATEGGHDPWDHSDDWESYEGTVVIPAGQTRTMIAYKGVGRDGSDARTDSIIDDLSFRLAYRLGYDANGGDKTDTSQIKASSDGTVKSIADKTSKVPVHDLEDTDVPGQYRDFILDTTKVKFSDVKFENGAWLNAPMPDSGDGATAMFPLKIGASATLPNVGEWTDGSGHTHSINAIISLHSWNGGSISRLYDQPPTSRDLFWINTVGRNSDLPAQVIKALGGIDTSKRVGCQWTVNFTYEDGTPVPDTFRGVTGFNDLDGWDAQPDLKFEGVQLVSGFDGAYKTRDAELATYGVNGFAGAKHDSGPESNLDSKQQIKHRLAATWTGSSFTFDYDLQNPEGRDRGCRMTFGVPVTRTKVLTYDANGGKGSVPSHTEAGKVESASVKTAGSVHAISDATDTTGSAEGKAVSGVLTDTTVDAGDGTRQRTITRSDGSVRVETIADTGAVSGCQVYYPAGTRITLATAKMDSDCWDSSQISKTNRTFYGWSANTDANDRDVPVGDTMDRNTLNANVRTEIVMPARAKTVYALWAINPTLSYNVNAPAGSNAPGTPASQTVPYNTAAADKSGWAAGDTGKIPGYRFDGWYTAPNGGNKYDFNTPLTGNVTVYAHWVGNGYTVRFTGNGATGGNTPDQAFQYNIGQNLRRNGFTRDGYTFTGWKRADNQQAYGDGQWVNNLTTQPNGIVTMVAQWSANEAHIRYNPNPPAGKTAGGNGTPNWDGHTGDTPAIGGNGWTIDGYTFAGWTTSPDGGGTKYAPGASWTANGTLTLYAQWTPGEAGLTYDGNGATGGKTDPQNGVTDQKVNVRQNGFTRDGYTFVRWDTQADCRGKAVNPGDKWTLQGSSTLYACWAGNAQTLTYHGNGATGGNTAAQSGHTGDELTTNANGFTRDGYTFVRWDTAKDGSGTAYGEGKNGVSQYTMKPAGNDLYAIWKANPASIVYRNGYPNTTGSTPDTTGSTGDTVTVSQNGFDRPGYTFTGWSTSKRGDPSLNPGDKHTLEPGTTTVWAQWKANPAHLVYNSNIGGIGSETRTVDGVVDQTVKTLGNPFDRPGYTFSGWNTQADGKGKAYDPGADCTLTANDKSTPKNTSVLYAQWTINKVTLKFDPNGGVGGYPSINTDAFGSVTIPKDAKEPKVTRPGFRFTGWSLKKTPDKDETLLTPGKDTVSMPAEGEVAVYAQWEPAMTTLPFTGGNAQIPTIWLWAGLAFLIIAAGAFSPMIRLRMGAGSKGRHAGTPTIGRHSR